MVTRYSGVLLIAAGLIIPTASWAGTLGVHFSWEETVACSTTPPAVTVTNIPKGTKYLVFKLVDHDAPNFVHGGGQFLIPGLEGCLRVRLGVRIMGPVHLKARSTRMNGLSALWII